MKNTISKYVVLFVVSIVFIPRINAASNCRYERQNELSATAHNVKYNTSASTKYDSLGYEYTAILVQIYNITNDIYITVNDINNKTTNRYTVTDLKNGMLEFEKKDPSALATYEIKVYSNDSTCLNDLLRIFEIRTPIANKYSTWSICKDAKEYYLCQGVINSEITMSEEDVVLSIKNYKSKKITENKSEEDQIIEDEKDYTTIIIATGSVLLIISVIVIVISYTKRKKSLI